MPKQQPETEPEVLTDAEAPAAEAPAEETPEPEAPAEQEVTLADLKIKPADIEKLALQIYIANCGRAPNGYLPEVMVDKAFTAAETWLLGVAKRNAAR